MHLHSPLIDYTKFHKEWIPSSSLPSNFGGELASLSELHENHRKILTDLRDYFIADEEEASNASK